MLAIASRLVAAPSFALVLLLGAHAVAQDLPFDDVICPYHQLKWTDFMAPVPNPPPYSAETDGGVDPSWSSVPSKMESDGTFSATLDGVKSSSFMNKSNSYSVPADQTPALLQHEQYHMDLWEYWARETEKRLKAVKGTGATAADAIADAQAKANDVITQAGMDCDAMQTAYDDETMHGTKAGKQAEWCKKVGALLAPPKPKDGKAATNGETSNSGYTPGTEELQLGDGQLESTSQQDVPVPDPVLQGAHVQLPPLFHVGDFMGGHPLLLPADGADTLRILGPSNEVILEGSLHVAFGDASGATYDAWVGSWTAPDPLRVAASPLLTQWTASGSPDVVRSLVLELAFAQPLPLATAGWTLPATVPVGMAIGTTNPEVWVDLLGSLPGSLAVPTLLGHGSMLPGETQTLEIEGSLPGAPTALVVGLSHLGAPFKGGTMVPAPDIVVGFFPTFPGNPTNIALTWPTGLPSHASTYWQCWMIDPGGVLGFAATNGLQGTTP